MALEDIHPLATSRATNLWYFSSPAVSQICTSASPARTRSHGSFETPATRPLALPHRYRTCSVKSLSPILMSLTRKSAPIVALYVEMKVLLT